MLGTTQFRGRGNMQQIHAAGSDLLTTGSAAVREGEIGKPIRL